MALAAERFLASMPAANRLQCLRENSRIRAPIFIAALTSVIQGISTVLVLR